MFKKTFHIKMRIAPEDKGILNNQNWIDISKSYAKKIGFENNLYAVYIHMENTDKEHIHIVASRIKKNNLAVRDNYTHYKNMDFARMVEQKYKLRKVKRRLEAIRKEEDFISQDKRTILLKDKILKAVTFSDNLDDLIFILKNQNIKVKVGRGISFTDENGIKKRFCNRQKTLS
ncbi:relaxase/mobilization nuclease domain-containing protein [Polaribacter ponticola]|uniref:Relaxase/mobilization nuclease domain-containing protein n=1 Tax=Polaribacter ponticola TaxID=2978475 RepID=A0ABT5S7L8_9FLAO|nr:relaxase/mobilization nuclease domain-containing protein [Polaribacter sp. MSW5]MDD7914094.1 relaxase/mobilization nuclease domain-containing protein [Polaribacter sp. MSW5]